MTLSGLKNIYPYTLRGRRDKDFLKFMNIELKGKFFGGVAQLGLEQRNHNPRVGGSSPSSATILFNGLVEISANPFLLSTH